MSTTHQCDKCGETITGAVAHLLIEKPDRQIQFDLCGPCERKFVVWLDEPDQSMLRPVEFWVIIQAVRYGLNRQSYAYDDSITLAHTHWAILDEATRMDVGAEMTRRLSL